MILEKHCSSRKIVMVFFAEDAVKFCKTMKIIQEEISNIWHF